MENMVESKDKNFWKEKNVLVTGADGFIGSWLAKSLIEKGANVVTIVRDIKKKSNIDIMNLREGIDLIHGDIVNYDICSRVLNEYNVDSVFHIAAQAIVLSANKSPLPTFESNIKGTWNILEACRLNKGVKRIVVASSDKAYGEQKKLPYKEESPLLGYYPYDASKACTDILARCYFKTYNLTLAVTRNANTYGPADMNFSRIIPDIIKTLINGKQPVIRSDGSPQRDYMFIKDSVNAYLTLAENLHRKEIIGESFNFGTGKPVGVLALLRKVLNLMKKENIKPKILGLAKNEIDRQYLSIEKAKRLLNWHPDYTLDQGLKETVDWYKSYFEK